jgi:hypothetical protein
MVQGLGKLSGIDTGCILFAGGEAMIRIVSGYKICDPHGAEYVRLNSTSIYYFDEVVAANAAETINTKCVAKPGYYRPAACFLLEVQTDRGKPLYFDLGSPVDIGRG